MLDKRGRNDAYMLEQEDLPEHLVQQLQFGLRSRVPNERERAIKQLAKTENREHKQVLRGCVKSIYCSCSRFLGLSPSLF
jgi:hypothetical protein